jgi:benzoyl-CoA reductase/2-hydroxyglutaryl-CoA dehydratase subunit BcrC/BadD/HgdB
MRAAPEAQQRLKGLLSAYYRRLGRRESPLAWCTSVGPAELLRSFGYQVYFPENHGALLGAKRLGGRCIPEAGRAGFSPDVCSYLTSDVGAFLLGETPLAEHGLDRVPVPDVLVYNTSQCRDVKEWFAFYADAFHAPLLGIETPRDIDRVDEPLLAYLESSWTRLIRDLEGVSGRRFDPDRYAAVLDLSGQACRLWQDFLEANRVRPARHDFFDQIILMAPVVVLRGEPEAVAFYRELLNEVATAPAGPVRERYRFFWEGMPVWGKIRFLAELFARHDARVVASTYGHSWTFAFDAADALRSSVNAYASIFITRSQPVKLDYLQEMCGKYSIDAVLFHDARTCAANTNSRYALPGKLHARTAVPVLTFFGDLVDTRHFSEAEFTLRFEAFLEQLG